MTFCVQCGASMGSPRALLLDARHLLSMLCPPAWLHVDCADAVRFDGVRFLVALCVNTRKDECRPRRLLNLRECSLDSVRPVLQGLGLAGPDLWREAVDGALDEVLEFALSSNYCRPEVPSAVEAAMHDRHQFWISRFTDENDSDLAAH